MPAQGEVARQWFIPGEGIDRHVISTDIQRYLGNDATVRPGVGTGEYQGVNGYWIKAYRNLTSAMIADLRADSQRWRQEQRQTGAGESYVGSRTYDQSNAARMTARQGNNNSPTVDDYPPGGIPPRGDGRQPRPPVDPMQIDPLPGRAPGNQYGQNYYPQQDPRAGQYGQDPGRGGFPPQGRGQQWPDQAMMDAYGPPDAYGRLPVSQYGQDRTAQNYGRAPPGPPTGYTQQGEYYVPMTSGYQQSGMMATAGADPYYRPQQPPMRGAEQPNQPRPRDNYGQQEYNPYPSPAQTVPDLNPRTAPPPSTYNPQPQAGYDQYGRPLSGPGFQPYQQDPGYAPQGRDPNVRQQQQQGQQGQQQPQPQRDGDRRHRRNG